MQIWDLFRGYEHAHGRYEVKRVSDRGKSEGRAVTHRQPLTQDLWDVHLVGSGPGVGVIPLLEDNTVCWACLDIDVYDLNHKELEDKIKKLELPLVICRTKSGGAHCFIFFKEPVDAKIVMDTLAGWAASLGYGGCEVFPKQYLRYDEEDVGNWLNMPYYHADMTTRYCIKDGEALELPEFLEYAESCMVTEEALLASPKHVAQQKNSGERVEVDDGGLFEEGPPCLQVLAAMGGFPDGTRNEGMFNVAVYLKKRFGDEWEDKLQEYNLALCDPPLSLDVIHTTAKSVGRKDYDYKCRKPPISAHCNRRICQRREWGVGEGAQGADRPEILDVKKYIGDTTYWYLTINGKRMMMTTDALLNQNMFKRQVADAISRVPRTIPQDRWDRYIDELIRDADYEEAPSESTHIGQFRSLLFGYLTGQARTVTREQLLVSQAPYVTGEGEVWFRFDGLIRYLDKQGFRYPSTNQVVLWLKDETVGAVPDEKSIKGKSTRIWRIAEPETYKDADEPVEFKRESEEF